MSCSLRELRKVHLILRLLPAAAASGGGGQVDALAAVTNTDIDEMNLKSGLALGFS